jgi:hypothetical protein
VKQQYLRSVSEELRAFHDDGLPSHPVIPAATPSSKETAQA